MRYDPSKTVAIQIETTGLNPEKDAIIEFCAIDGNYNVLLDTYVNPGEKYIKKGWPEAQAVNHIKPDQVSDAPYFESIRPQIIDIINNAKNVIMYNEPFIDGFLIENSVNLSLQSPYNVMNMFADKYGECNSDGDVRRKKLSFAANFYNYDWGKDKHYTALSKCKATMYLFCCLKNISFQSSGGQNKTGHKLFDWFQNLVRH